MAVIAQSYMLRDEPDSTSEWADKALALAADSDLVAVQVAAKVEKGSALIEEPEGRALLKEAITEAERTGNHVLAARALNNLVWHAREWSSFDEVKELIWRMRRHAEAAGFESLSSVAQAEAFAHLATFEGDVQTAIDMLDEILLTDHRWLHGKWLAILRAGLALEAGDLAAAERYTEMSKPAAQRTALAVVGLDFHMAARRGDLAAARAHLRDLLALVDDKGHIEPDQAHDLLSAALTGGITPDEMRPLVDRTGRHVGHRLAPDDPWFRLLNAQLAEAEGRTEDALAGFAAASAEPPQTHKMLAGHVATAHLGAARALIALGRLDEARTHTETAAEQLAKWKGWRVDELRAVERRLGLGPEPAGPESLTPREREVVALLAEGLSNSQLAERLYISPRTAAVHVSNILAKLDKSSRAEVAAWAVREGLGPTGPGT
jgi:DNA-binding CsgD family transcriptional regulator